MSNDIWGTNILAGCLPLVVQYSTVQYMQSIAHNGLQVCAIRMLSHRTSVNKQWIVSHEECTRFHEKTSTSVIIWRRSGPPTEYLNV